MPNRSTVLARRRGGWLLCWLALAMGLAAGCKKKKEPAPAPEQVSGLEAIPAAVQVVVGVNVRSLRGSWLVQRALEQMFRRDPGLEGRIDGLIASCRFDPAKDLDSFIIGLGSDQEADQAVMVVTGNFAEAELARCVGQSMAQDGGSLTISNVDGRSFYSTIDGAGAGRESVWFTLSGSRTLVVATSSAWLQKAVGKGDKIASSPRMAELLGKVDRSAGIWAAGTVDDRIGAGLVALTKGQVATAPQAMFGHLQLGTGVTAVLGAVMGSEDDANYLNSKIKSQLILAPLALQRVGLGVLSSKLGVDSEGKTVYLRLSLSEGEIEEALSRIDTTAGSTQDPAAK